MEEAKLLSYLEGGLTEQENLEVENWQAQSDENRHCLEQIYYTGRLARCAEAYGAADVEAALAKFRRRVAAVEKPAARVALPADRWRTWWKRYGMAAAAFFTGLIMASGVLLGMYGSSSVYEVSTLPGQRARVILPDGTAVWLNSSTELTYRSGLLLGEREAHLNGEAYFEVKRNTFRPFVVNSHGVRTEVLGTIFNVRARNNEKQVVTTLFQGSVRMYADEQDEAGKQLSPGQTMCVDVESGQAGLYAFDRPQEVLLWIKGEMRFDNKPLGAIMDCLSKVHNVKVTFADNRLKEKRFTCIFKTDTSLEEVLSTLELTHHFTYEYKETDVVIKPVE